MQLSFPTMKRDQQSPVGPQNSIHLLQSPRHRRSFEMDNRVKRDDSRKGVIWHIERQHVALLKGDIRIQASRTPNHLRRQINTAHTDSTILQIPRDLPWATTDFAHLPQLRTFSANSSSSFRSNGLRLSSSKYSSV